jgi:hypothetical protein
MVRLPQRSRCFWGVRRRNYSRRTEFLIFGFLAFFYSKLARKFPEIGEIFWENYFLENPNSGRGRDPPNTPRSDKRSTLYSHFLGQYPLETLRVFRKVDISAFRLVGMPYGGHAVPVCSGGRVVLLGGGLQLKTSGTARQSDGT